MNSNLFNRRHFLKTIGLGAATMACPSVLTQCQKHPVKPNIILFLADDLGYGELGCYGQKKIKTPNIDKLAAEGMRFMQHYAGSPVCAPSRCTLLTGKHTGHAFIRKNQEIKPEGQLPIPDNTITVAELLKAQGYATAAIGKWGLGFPGSEGDPNRQGFDLFYGYNCQRHAHNYYPRYLWKNETKVELPGNDRGLTGTHYAPDLMETEALTFIRQNKNHPFFLYFPTIVPHLALQVPEDSLKQYRDKWDDPPYDGKKGYLPHPHPWAAYAAMVTRMDRTVGRIVKLVKELKIEDNTLILFASDNGPTYLGGYDRDFFQGAGPLRSHKGYVYEGGIRIPMIARWQGRIKPGSVSDHISAFWDVLPTLCEITGAKIPKNVDGISFAATLFGKGNQKQHEYLYWEFPSYGGQQAVRMGDWKGIRKNMFKGNTKIELYNLKDDIGEQNDVSDKNPQIVQQIENVMHRDHVPSNEFKFKQLDE